MKDTIDAVIADLEEAGRPGQVRWAGPEASREEGAIVVRRDGPAVVVTQLWRDQGGDRVTRFASESEAAAELRRRLVDPPVRHLTASEREAMMQRTRQQAEETKARLDASRESP